MCKKFVETKIKTAMNNTYEFLINPREAIGNLNNTPIVFGIMFVGSLCSMFGTGILPTTDDVDNINAPSAYTQVVPADYKKSVFSLSGGDYNEGKHFVDGRYTFVISYSEAEYGCQAEGFDVVEFADDMSKTIFDANMDRIIHKTSDYDFSTTVESEFLTDFNAIMKEGSCYENSNFEAKTLQNTLQKYRVL
jgi:hypothetical protein